MRTILYYKIMEFKFSKEKNEVLIESRGISFDEVIEAIGKEGVLLEIEHPNQKKFPDQSMFVVNIDNYAYCVPYVKNGKVIFLKTIYPNRKFKHLINGEKNE
ncbi:MAG: toxin [bacterium]